MDGGTIMNENSTSYLYIENDEKVKSGFDDAREQPNSLNPTPITSNSTSCYTRQN